MGSRDQQGSARWRRIQTKGMGLPTGSFRFTTKKCDGLRGLWPIRSSGHSCIARSNTHPTPIRSSSWVIGPSTGLILRATSLP